MDQQPVLQSRVYRGATPEAAQDAFRADAQRAEESGWSVASQRWDTSQPEPTLVVDYVPRNLPLAYASAPKRRRTMSALGAVAIGLLAVAIFAVVTTIGSLGRIERPEDGYAVTFPFDWSAAPVAEVDPSAPLELTRAVAAIPRDSSRDDTCIVLPFSLGPAGFLDDETLLVAVAAQFGTRFNTADLTPVDLPAGRAMRGQFRAADGRPAVAYVIVGTGMAYMLGCVAETMPTDKWLSIAKTFEFLPAT